MILWPRSARIDNRGRRGRNELQPDLAATGAGARSRRAQRSSTATARRRARPERVSADVVGDPASASTAAVTNRSCARTSGSGGAFPDHEMTKAGYPSAHC